MVSFVGGMRRVRSWEWGALLGVACSVAAACGADVDQGAGSSGSAAVASSSAVSGVPGLSPAPAAARAPAANRDGQSLARAPTDDALFLADEDHKAVRAFPLPLEAGAKATTFELPARPAQLIALEHHVLVTIRDDRDRAGLLLVLERQGALGLREAGRVELPADAWGIAVDPKETFAVVTSAWTAKVSVVDLATLSVRATLDVAREPRGVTILPDGKTAFVSHLVGSGITRIDGLDATPAAKALELPAAPLRSPVGKDLPASLGYAAVASPEGDRVYFPRHALGALANDAWFGTASVDVLLPARSEALAPKRRYGSPSTFVGQVVMSNSNVGWFGGSTDVADEGWNAFVQPRAAVYRRSERTLLVASEGANSLVELDAELIDPTLGVMHTYKLGEFKHKLTGSPTSGGAPSGIALSADEKVAYVHCRSTDEIAIVPLDEGEGTYERLPPPRVRFADPDPDEKVALGRSLFYDATDRYVSGGLGCAGCHPDGRDDGHVWHEVKFKGYYQDTFANFLGSAEQLPHLRQRWKDFTVVGVDGPPEAPRGVGTARQTPMLAGRVDAPGPYGWHGESSTLHARVVTGFFLHRWLEDTMPPLDVRADFLTTFLRRGLVPPPRGPAEQTAELERGKVIFESAATKCATCHVAKTGFTDRASPPLLQPPPPAGFIRDESDAFKTPSLRYVGGTPPYFHDGRYRTLEELVDKNADRMGTTSHLDADGKKALVAYLRSL